jgi:hypothetical protein
VKLKPSLLEEQKFLSLLLFKTLEIKLIVGGNTTHEKEVEK